MRLTVLQGVYPSDTAPASRERSVAQLAEALDQLDPGPDLLVMPEYGNCPGAATRDDVITMINGVGAELFALTRRTAQRLGTHIAFNGVVPAGESLRNCTILLGRDGTIIERYDKTHLTRAESEVLGLEPGSRLPLAVLDDGTRIGFATCFELYFAEYFEAIAAARPDIVVVPTYQRSEERRVLTFQMQARAADTGAFLARSSWFVPGRTDVAGESAIVHPDGRILDRVGDHGGIASIDIDPHARWVRPRSAGQEPASARDIVEESRRPLLYRHSGGAAPRWDGTPRVVAHRGFSRACPENTMAAFEAAVALGSDEVELDLWPTRDGELAVLHDDTVDRTTNGTGRVDQLDWATLAGLDAGGWFGPAWEGLSIPRAADVLAAIGPRQTLNLHIKDVGADGWVITAVKDLVLAHGLTDAVYVAGDHEVLQAARDLAPELARCCLAEQASWRLVDTAISYECTHLQFFTDYVDARQVARAHEAGIRCNVFYADDPAEADRLYALGIDAVLTNDVAAVLPVAWRRGHPSPTDG